MTEPAPPTTPKKSDLGVRTASAVVMVAVAGTALWLGGWVWAVFVAAVALGCFLEFIALINKAFDRPIIRAVGGFAAFVYVGLSCLYMWVLRVGGYDDSLGYGAMMSVVTILGVVIFTDVGAYFSGRAIGGPKIAPKISPSKTWAGLAGGMLAAAIWRAAAEPLDAAASLASNAPRILLGVTIGPRQFSLTELLTFAAMGASLAVVAQSGDFFESWLKRRAGVKDSSKLIPGHGGIFDRIDGLLAVLFVMFIFELISGQ